MLCGLFKNWRKKEPETPQVSEASQYVETLEMLNPADYNHFTLNHLIACLKILPGTVTYDLEVYFPDGSMLNLSRLKDEMCLDGVPEYVVFHVRTDRLTSLLKNVRKRETLSGRVRVVS
jgi:hypothetical protein